MLMKRCPQCNQTFTDELNFCLNDGKPLIVESYTDAPTVAISTAPTDPMFQPGQVSLPTVVQLPATQPAYAAGPKESPKWPYVVIGGLAMALIALGLLVFVPKLGQNSGNEKTQITAADPVAAPAAANTTPSRKPAAWTTGTPTTEPANLNYPSPGGRYSGDWISKMTSYGAVVDITEVAGKITGQIVWTLRSSPNPKKVNKIGTTAIEYINGTYNPQTRMLELHGFRKDDPNDIIILDKYNLSVAADNQTIIGKSINGEFILKR